MYRRFLIPSITVMFLSMVFVSLTAWFGSEKSITFDETFYLSCGLQSVHDGSFDHRIAGSGVAPLPIILTYIIPLSNMVGEDRPKPWEGKFNDRNFIKWPRIVNSILFGVSLIFLIFIWLYHRQGLVAAMLGAVLATFSPTLLANASLATTDSSFAFFGTLGIATTAWYFGKPSRLRFIFWAIAIAAAMASKYSALFLLPTAGILLFLNTDIDPLTESFFSKLKKSLQQFVVLLGLVIPVWWGFHLFTFAGPLKTVAVEVTPDDSPWVKMLGRGPRAEQVMDISHTILKRPAPIAGVVSQYLHNGAGHSAFLMGKRSTTGWWYFFPSTFAFKSTPSELVIGAFLILLLCCTFRSPRASWKSLDSELQAIFLGVFVFSGMVLAANINIGHRYLIVMYPLLIIAGVDRLFTHLKRHPKRIFFVGAFLVGGQITSSLMTAPNYLAYFNSLCGGPEQGWHLLTDSSIDWGQDLPALKKKLAGMSHEQTAVSYFGTANLCSYGIHCDKIDNLSRPVESYQQLAISVTSLQGVYEQGDDPFGWFRSLPSDARAGYSIFLYSLNTPERKQAFAEGVKQTKRKIAQTVSTDTSE